MLPKNFNQYKKTQVTTASKETVLLMLFEGAIKFMKKAKTAIEASNIPEKGQNILKAHDIVSELLATLNHEVNPQLANQLESLYNFVTDELVRANIHNKTEHLDAAIKIMTILKEGWDQAINSMNPGAKTNETKESAAEEPAPNKALRKNA